MAPSQRIVRPDRSELIRLGSRRCALVAASLALAACGGGGSGDARAPELPTTFAPTTVGEALEYGVQNGIDGLWVFIDDASAAATLESAGVQDRTTRAPARTDSQFKIASISKMFIAASAVKMVEQGLLRLDDTLAFWLPAESTRLTNANQITVQQLLQHRSGVPDFDSQPAFFWEQPHTDDETLLDMVYDLPADFAPDAQYTYSNTNYLLLGRILNAALGYHHHQFVQNEFLSPLGMVDTVSLLSATQVDRLARGYWDTIDRTEQDYAIAGGSMVSTASDVGVFLRALATGDGLTDVERQRYRTLFGSFGHSGWLPGYQSQARYLPGSDVVVVLFANTTGGQSEAVASDVFDAILGLIED